MTKFQPRDPDFEARLWSVFDGPGSLRSLGANLLTVRPGWVELVWQCNAAPVPPGGPPHPGLIAAVLAGAGEYAALTLCPADCRIVPVEYKVNFIATGPASDSPACDLSVQGEVVRAGRTLTVCTASSFTRDDPGRPVAYMLATYTTVSSGASPGTR